MQTERSLLSTGSGKQRHVFTGRDVNPVAEMFKPCASPSCWLCLCEGYVCVHACLLCVFGRWGRGPLSLSGFSRNLWKVLDSFWCKVGETLGNLQLLWDRKIFLSYPSVQPPMAEHTNVRDGHLIAASAPTTEEVCFSLQFILVR